MFLEMIVFCFRILYYTRSFYFVDDSFYESRFAYIRQEDLFFSQLTVQETLSLAAELQLPSISSTEERDKYVNDLLFKTGLVGFVSPI